MDFITFQNTCLKREVIEVPNQVPANPMVSILVQTYQHEHYIKECIKGILAQKTNFTYEILIGEDNSRDKTREICLAISKKHPDKVRLFLHHRENQKKILEEPTANFNAFYNFFSARGKYYAFCEGDDLWADPEKLQRQIDFLILNPEYVLTYHNFVTITSNGDPVESIEAATQPTSDLSQKELTEGIFHPLLLTVCFKKDFTELPSEMFEVINIDTFLLSFLGNYGKGKYLNDIQPSKYRKHQGGIWSARIKEKKILSKIITYYQLQNYYWKNNNMKLYTLYKQRHLNHYKMLLLKYIRRGNWRYIFPLILKYLKERKVT